MKNKEKTIKKVYESILADKNTFNILKQALGEQSQLDEKFITKKLLPLAQKLDPEITWQDILNYEKEALSHPTELTLSDLENISGGKASNVLLSCGLLALMGFSGIASHSTSAVFIPFTQTKEYQDYEAYKAKGDAATEEEKNKYENTDLGEVPFYQQADHLVDGLLWFYNEENNTAFYVMDRTFNGKGNAIYTYATSEGSSLGVDKPTFDEIQANEHTLFKVDSLTGYLKASFENANTIAFNPGQHNDSQTVQRVDDNPLYNYAKFYNPSNAFENRTSVNDFDLKNLHKLKMLGTLSENPPDAFQSIRWCEKIENDPVAKELAENVKQSMMATPWTIAHRTKPPLDSKTPPSLKKIESYKTLKHLWRSHGFSGPA